MGEKKIKIGDKCWSYKGQFDDQGLACGQGEAFITLRPGARLSYNGTFYSGKFEGIGK